MDRWACLDLPALPLQLLLSRQGGADDHPAAVVAADKPRAGILWVNRAARRRRILPGMSYAEGLALSSDLRAGTVSEQQIRGAVQRVTDLLHHFSPRVEPCAEEPGVFWLDASGLARVFGTVKTWGSEVLAAVRRGAPHPGPSPHRQGAEVGGHQTGLQARLAVGFSRFGSYATARRGAGDLVVHATAEQEREYIRGVPLARLGVEPRLRVALDRLGIKDVAGLWGLSAGGLLERFGERAHRLSALSRGELWAPLDPAPQVEPVRRKRELDHPTVDLHRLLFRIKQELDALLRQLAARHQDLTALHLVLDLDAVEGATRWCRVRPARPTRDSVQIVDLVRLRLQRIFEAAQGDVPGPVRGFALEAEGVDHGQTQLDLFSANPRRDPARAEQALARLRAELGAQAVVRARLRSRHLPEEAFSWEPVSRLRQARPQKAGGSRRLVRRLFHPPRPLPQPSMRPRARGLARAGGRDAHRMRKVRSSPGSPKLLTGPQILDGGWWDEAHRRRYHYARAPSGELLWLYRDEATGQWFIHGVVE